MNLAPLACLPVALALGGCSDNSNKIVLERIEPAPAQVNPVSVPATGANFADSNGIAFNADNGLYVASVIGSSLTVLDPDSGEIIRQWGAIKL